MPMRKIKPIIPRNEMPEMPEKIYPCVSIPLSALPEAKKWAIDGKYTIKLEVEMKSLYQEEDDKGDARFEIYAVESLGEIKSNKQRKPRYAEEA